MIIFLLNRSNATGTPLPSQSLICGWPRRTTLSSGSAFSTYPTLVKRSIRGTFQGRFEPKYLQNYLDEYVVRFNRRKSRNIGKKSMRIVQQALKTPWITWPEIPWNLDPLSEYVAATGAL
jgi:hypothetical protein